jgi:hypothetical protein
MDTSEQIAAFFCRGDETPHPKSRVTPKPYTTTIRRSWSHYTIVGDWKVSGCRVSLTLFTTHFATVYLGVLDKREFADEIKNLEQLIKESDK